MSRSYLRPERAGPALGLLVAAQLVAAPAFAETRQANLGVSATVLPSCTVSTQSGAVSTSCSNFGDGSIAIKRDRTAVARPPAHAASPPNPQRPSEVIYLTITY